MANKITLEYCGVEASGRTVTEAKRAATVKIERMVGQSTEIYGHNGHTLVIVPTVHGSTYSIVPPDVAGQHYCCSMGGDMEEVREGALRHLIEYTRAVGDVSLPGWYPDRYRKAALAHFESMDRFQLAYRDAKARGLAENDAHTYACDAMHVA